MSDILKRRSGNIEYGKRESSAQLDQRLVGLWLTHNAQVRIISNGKFYSVGGASTFSISADGNTLTLVHSGGQEVLTRISGSGSNLLGEWYSQYDDGGVTWEEQTTYNGDGTYLTEVKADGQLDGVYAGTYRTAGNKLASEEYRAIMETSGSDVLELTYSDGQVYSGTYEFDDTTDKWFWIIDGLRVDWREGIDPL